MRRGGDDDELPVPEELKGSFGVLRRGVRESPELRKGLGFTLIISLGITAISLVTPVLVQQVFDNGFTPEFKPRFVYGICLAAFALVIVAFLAARAGRSSPGARLGGSPDEPARAHVRAHPPAVDRRAERGEAGRVRRASDRRCRLAAAVHGVGRHRMADLVRAGLRSAGADALLLLAARDRGRAADGAARRGHGLDAVAPVGRVRRRPHARGRDALRGERERDGRRRGARVRPRRHDPRQGHRRDRATLRRRGEGAPARRDAVADVERVLRADARGRDRRGGAVRPRLGTHGSARRWRSCSSATCS